MSTEDRFKEQQPVGVGAILGNDQLELCQTSHWDPITEEAFAKYR